MGKIKMVFKYWWGILLRSEKTIREFFKGFIVSGILLLLSYIAVVVLFTFGIVQIDWVESVVGDFVSFGTLGLGLFVGLIVFLCINFFIQPVKLNKEKDEIIKKHIEKNNFITSIPNLFLSFHGVEGEIREYVSLMVVNNSKNKKIVELGAKARITFCSPSINNDEISSLETGEVLIWENHEELIELRPDAKAHLLVGYLDDNKFGVGVSGSLGSDEMVCQLTIELAGKYEGENDFMNKRDIRTIYSFQKEGKIAFSQLALTDYKDLQPKIKEILDYGVLGKKYPSNKEVII